MKDYVNRSQLMEQAKQDFQGYPWFGEIGLFILVFIVGSILQAVVILPAQLVLLFTDAEYMSAALAGNAEAIMQASMRISTSDPAMVASLFAFIGLIVSALFIGKWVGKRKMGTHGFTKQGLFKEYGIGLLVGFAMFTAAYLLCLVFGTVKPSLQVGSPVMIVLFLLGFMVQGMGEEVICRSLLMVNVSRRYSVPVAIFINSLTFAALHLGNGGLNDPVTSIIAMFNLFLFGVVMSLYYIKRGNIWGIGAIHSIWNFVQGNFYGIRVSGMELTNSVFASDSLEAGKLLNGGAFGLEGGLAVTIVLVICTVIFFKMPGQNVSVAAAAQEGNAQDTAQQ